jgi:putative spermidine/putrescine transport system ATP-binding protein
MLDLRNLRKVYRGSVAVDDVSFVLGKGEFLTLLGPSGSGKTTTLQMIAGLTPPSSGSILLEGRELTPLPPYKRNIGVVFQHYALFPHMTVGKNIRFPLEMRGIKGDEIRQKVSRVLEVVGLPDFEDRFPSQLSGGQQQRVALARAVVFEPRLLLMDEPLGALDRKFREQLQIEIMRVHRELGVSIIYVTHDQEEALVMSDRIAVFNRGRIVQIDEPSALYERPNGPFVAGFLGESNFFPVTVYEADEEYCRGKFGSSILRGRRASGVETGMRAVVFVRPEKIVISSLKHDGADNSIDGVIREIVYLGRNRKYLIATNLGVDVVGYQPLDGNEQSMNLGMAVRLSWSARDSRILSADGEGGIIDGAAEC